MAYDAFISYSHGADLDLAPVVRDGLQRLAKPWNRRRALNVFLDQASLELSSELSGSLDERIEDTRWLVLFMSEESARSRWVDGEISEWAAKKSKEQIALALTSGEVVWDDEARDFDYERSTAVSEGMRGLYAGQNSEPLFLDLRWTKEFAEGEKSLDLNNLKFRDAIATLAAPIHGIPKDQLEGEDIRQFRLARRLRRAAVSGLAMLTVIAVAAGIWAEIQRAEAIVQRDRSESRRLAAVSEANAVEQTDLAQLLALESLAVSENEEGWAALFESLSRPYLARSPMTGHDDVVNRVALSPVAPLVASSSDDGTVRLWDTASGGQSGEMLVGHGLDVEGLAFSPGGDLVASGDSAGNVVLWDVVSRSRKGEPMVGHEDVVWDLAFSPDGSRLVSASIDGWVRLWDVETQRELWSRRATVQPEFSAQLDLAEIELLMAGLAGAWVLEVAFSADGLYVASATKGGTVRLWEAASGRQIAEPLRGEGGWGQSAAFAPGLALLAAAGDDDTVRLFDLASGQPVGGPLVGHRDEVQALAFAVGADGLRLATAGRDRTIRLWDLSGEADEAGWGEPIGEPMTGHDGAVFGLAFGLDGSRLASGSSDASVRLWDLASGHQVGRPLTGQEGLRSVAVTADGALAASGDGAGGVWLWDLSSGTPLGVLPDSHRAVVSGLAFNPDGSMLATASSDGTVGLWSVASRSLVRRLRGHNDIRGVAFSADGSRLAASEFDGTLRVWKVDTGEQVTAALTGHEGLVEALVFSRDGRLLASAGSDGTVRLWEVGSETGSQRTLTTDPPLTIWAVAFLEDGSRLASASLGGTVRLWDVATGQEIGEPPISGQLEWNQAAAFDHDGTLLATTTRDGTLQIWDVASGQRVGEPLRGHGKVVWDLAFSRDGRLLTSVSEDDTLRLWPAPRGWPALACAVTGRNLTLVEWREQVDDERAYRRLCDRYGSGSGAPPAAAVADLTGLRLTWKPPAED